MFESLIALLRELAAHKLAQVLFWIAAATVLYGVVDSHLVLLAIGLLVGVRVLALAMELSRKRMTDADWHARYQSLVMSFASIGAEELADTCEDYGLPRGASAHNLARAWVDDDRRAYRPPRTGWSASAECAGMLALLVLFPATVAFFAFDFVDYRRAQDWLGLIVVAAGAALYWWPLQWEASSTREARQAWWWGLSLLVITPLCTVGFSRHSYLDPRAPTATAADSVLRLADNVTASRYADWVFRHAAALAAAGEKSVAISYYQRGLHLAPQAVTAQRAIAKLEGREMSEAVDADAPYWADAAPPDELEDCSLDARLGAVPSATIVLVRAGDVSITLMRRLGYVLQRELKLRVCFAAQNLLLPAHGRTRGLVGGPQWDVAAVTRSFMELLDPPPPGPLKYLVVTDVDIYAEGANFVFSMSYEYGAVLSSARFEEASDNELELHARVAKQALGAVIKSFGVPASTDPNCVTSYSNGLAQFDRKGDRPTHATHALLSARVAALEAEFRR